MTQNNLIAALEPERCERVEDLAAQCRPVTTVAVAALIGDYLQHKAARGTSVELGLYEGLTPSGLSVNVVNNAHASARLHRSLRPLPPAGLPHELRALLCPPRTHSHHLQDAYLLQDGSSGCGGFDQIGSAAERAPLTLDRFLSYDDMQIAALIGLSGPTFFINNGSRGSLLRRADYLVDGRRLWPPRRARHV